MNLLFWNMNNKTLKNELRELVRVNDVDILILAECLMSDVEVLSSINQSGLRTFVLPFNPSPRLSFYTRLLPETIIPLSDIGGASIRHLIPPIGDDFILVGVHLLSKLAYENTDQLMSSTRLIHAVEEAENRIGHDRTIILGDFNMNPFESGLTSADAFHAVMDKRTATEIERTVQGEKRKYFFNPMWSRLGDASKGPPGTFYYRRSSQVCYFWNTFDQVLLRPSLLPYFNDKDLSVITNLNGKKLLDHHGRPNASKYSDHLPLFVHLTIERSVIHDD